MKTYSVRELKLMNFNSKYGSQWIKNANNINDSELYHLYATRDAYFSGGKIYIALPVHKNLTPEDKKRYNLI